MSVCVCVYVGVSVCLGVIVCETVSLSLCGLVAGLFIGLSVLKCACFCLFVSLCVGL